MQEWPAPFCAEGARGQMPVTNPSSLHAARSAGRFREGVIASISIVSLYVLYMYMYVCICMCEYVNSIYIYIYIHTYIYCYICKYRDGPSLACPRRRAYQYRGPGRKLRSGGVQGILTGSFWGPPLSGTLQLLERAPAEGVPKKSYDIWAKGAPNADRCSIRPLILVQCGTVSSRTENLDFGGFGSSRFLILRGGVPRSLESFP